MIRSFPKSSPLLATTIPSLFIDLSPNFTWQAFCSQDSCWKLFLSLICSSISSKLIYSSQAYTCFFFVLLLLFSWCKWRHRFYVCKLFTDCSSEGHITSWGWEFTLVHNPVARALSLPGGRVLPCWHHGHNTATDYLSEAVEGDLREKKIIWKICKKLCVHVH